MAIFIGVGLGSIHSVKVESKVLSPKEQTNFDSTVSKAYFQVPTYWSQLDRDDLICQVMSLENIVFDTFVSYIQIGDND